MATLEILDGGGIARDLRVTIAGSEYIPHHVVESSALPTGAATEATLATIDTDTGAIATSTASIDGKITACNTGAVVISAALPAGTNNIGDVDVLSLPTVSAVTTVSTVTSLTQMNGQAIAMGTGVRTAGTQRVTIATDDSVPVTGTFWQATQPVSIATAPALVASSATIGDVALVGRTSGGLTLHSRLSTGTDSTNVKASAGQVFWGFVTNTNASARYIKFYNSASTPTLGSGTPVARFMIPPNSSGLQITAEQGLTFSTGIGYTLSTGAADSDTGTVAANEVIVNLGYR